MSRTYCGSTVYAAPEILTAKNEYDPRYSDVWSCGIVLYAMLTAKMPFGRDLLNKFVKLKIVEGKNCFLGPTPNQFLFSSDCTSECIRDGDSSNTWNIII